MKLLVFSLKLFFIVIWAVPGSSNVDNKKFNEEITLAISPNWPYQAFLAIPRISQIKPMVSIEISKEDKTISSTTCIEVGYFELQKKIKLKSILERESLHRLLCQAMKRAVKKTNVNIFLNQGFTKNHIGLRFDFYNGIIELAEIPYPPLDPFLLLEDVLVNEDDKILFGDIDLPKEIELDITETPL